MSDIGNKYNKVLESNNILSRQLLSLKAAMGVFEIYLDENHRIRGYSHNFPSLAPGIVKLKKTARGLHHLLDEHSYSEVADYYRSLRSLGSLPYDEGAEWELKYSGPGAEETIGRDWIVFGESCENNWMLAGDDGLVRIVHKAHIEDECDCYLMSTRQYGGPEEDIKVVYRVRTSEVETNIRDLSLVLNGDISRMLELPESSGYSVCTASTANSQAKIQRQLGTMELFPESLAPGTIYEITVERTGGRLLRSIRNCDSGEPGRDLVYIDHDALYDRSNHLGFTTFAGDMEIMSVQVYTRPSVFSIDQFRLPCDLTARIEDEPAAGRLFRLKTGREVMDSRMCDLLIFEDITRLWESEEKSARINILLERTLGSLHEAVLVIEPHSYRILDCNAAMEKIFGYSQQEVVGRSLDILLKQDCPFGDLRRRFDEALGERGEFNIECRMRRKNGEVFYSDQSFTEIRDEHGGWSAIVNVIRDVTKQKLAEYALRESEKRLRSIFDEAAIGIEIGAMEGNILDFNPAFEKMLGYTRDELLQKKYSDITVPDDLNLEKKYVQEMIDNTRSYYQIEKRFTRKDGNLLYGRLTVSLVKDEKGEPQFAIGMVEDITERKKAQQELEIYHEQLRSLSAHLHSVREEERAHIAREIHDELGQLLTAIKIDVALLQGRLEGKASGTKDRFEEISSSIDNAVQAVQKIAGDLKPGLLDELGLKAALEWEVEKFEERTGIECAVSFEFEDEDLEASIATNLFRVAQEALTNVTRHAQATEVALCLWKRDASLVLKVDVNGVGIPPGKIDDPHSFGLMGMRERVNSLGGDHAIESRPGGGTSIRVNIPLEERLDHDPDPDSR